MTVALLAVGCNVGWDVDELHVDAATDPADMRPEDAAVAPAQDPRDGASGDPGDPPSSGADAAMPMPPDPSPDAGAVADAGAGPLTCVEPERVCDEACTNVLSDPLHCGDCTTRCDEGLVCREGDCAADCGDLTECEGHVCADLSHDVDHCGDCDTVCARPAANGKATCEGTCGIACDDTYRQCGNGCYKLDDVDHCGVSCTKCQAPPNSRATCNGTACGSACLGWTMVCGGGGGNACGSWNFESGTAEGWTVFSDSDGTGDVLTPSTAHVAEGARSVVTPFVSTVSVKVALCPNANAVNLNYRKFSARMYIEAPAFEESPDNFVQFHVEHLAGGGQTAGGLSKPVANTWLTLKGTLGGSGFDAVDTIMIFTRIGQPGVANWSGKLYLDDVKLEP